MPGILKAILYVVLFCLALYAICCLAFTIFAIASELKSEMDYKKSLQEKKQWQEITLGEISKECLHRMLGQASKGEHFCQDCKYRSVCGELRGEDPWAWSNPRMRGEV